MKSVEQQEQTRIERLLASRKKYNQLSMQWARNRLARNHNGQRNQAAAEPDAQDLRQMRRSKSLSAIHLDFELAENEVMVDAQFHFGAGRAKKIRFRSRFTSHNDEEADAVDNGRSGTVRRTINFRHDGHSD